MAKGEDQLEGRNVVLAALTASGRVRRVLVDDRAKPDDKLREIRRLCSERKAAFEFVPRGHLKELSETGVHNGVIAFAAPLPRHTLKEVLDRVDAEGRDPFIVLLDEVQYEHNLGAVLRSAAASGADAVVVPTRRGAPVGSVVQRVAMGGAEEVPVVREGLNSALATLKRYAVKIVGAEANGAVAWHQADLTGRLAIVMGGEDHGLGPKVRSRCDQIASISLRRDSVVTSLNVSVAAGLLLFERVRQIEVAGDA